MKSSSLDLSVAELTSHLHQEGLFAPEFDLQNYDFAWLNQSYLSPELIRHYRVIPLEIKNNILHIGVANPLDQHILEIITFHTGLRIYPVVVAENQLKQFIETYYNEVSTENNLELTLLKEIPFEENPSLIQENATSYDEPLVKFVNNMIQHAVQQSASDIHIEPHKNICRIRYRRDGLLYKVAEIPIHITSRLVTRLKVLAKLDITEHRLPQDGRFQLHAIDIRLNVCPTLFGEKIVLRLLDVKKISLQIDTLGFNEAQKDLFIKEISQPHGMILVTGPTGSGKTVTLYSALQYLNTIEKNISTVEDPVEIQIKGTTQVNVNPKIGLDFATILRTFLRQDPDIIMVGEIRDKETAEIAIQAAQTGHLVFSTLHTNSAIEAITRLQSMGIAMYNIISSLSLVISQRLVRKLCPRCKQPEILPAALLATLQITAQQPIFHAGGCQQCLQGYQGRTGIYEFFPFTQKITQLMMSGANTFTLAQQVQAEGFLSLQQAGIEKVLQGITSLSEINRVI